MLDSTTLTSPKDANLHRRVALFLHIERLALIPKYYKFLKPLNLISSVFKNSLCSCAQNGNDCVELWNSELHASSVRPHQHVLYVLQLNQTYRRSIGESIKGRDLYLMRTLYVTRFHIRLSNIDQPSDVSTVY